MTKQFSKWVPVIISMLLTASASRGQEWLSTPRPIGTVEDLTARTGINVAGNVAQWSASWSDGKTQHAAGRTPAGALYVLSWGDGNVRADNVTTQTGVSISGAPVLWFKPWQAGENLAAISDKKEV